MYGLSGIDERPVKEEIPDIELSPSTGIDWWAGTYPELMRIDRNEIRRIRRKAARNTILVALIFLVFDILALIWCCVVAIPGVVVPIMACVFFIMVIKDNVETYRNNGEVIEEEELFVWHRGKTD